MSLKCIKIADAVICKILLSYTMERIELFHGFLIFWVHLDPKYTSVNSH